MLATPELPRFCASPAHRARPASPRYPNSRVLAQPPRVSLRRHRPFALIAAASAKRLQLGVNLADAAPTDRLLLAGGICTHTLSVTSLAEVDPELLGWLRAAYEGN
ncbi:MULTISPECIES: DUF5655 domain-containing protein [Cryobacterium]|uniref:DUF5655 domain-containing protein n=1 Tax=Cryobacterium levicorallinum TaxID=995038 RepID=A0A1I3CWF2_9MICO|nr:MULTISPECIES: DUF5655 domain-containing protein [Cryobacterium]TFB78587.1 hypothetical protein E3O11_17030 [Cryobacterium levicorallinum]TFD55961.1 hypothetical protein E3T41_16690 [Cryobacterium sp. Hh38]GEP27881.1 hypothetical protein CLE01_24790 [Cryobacterium levicorallinum]SFH78561.1 hypothetical protein SAMN05216274_11512 [Cryobacterium levicorallinum]